MAFTQWLQLPGNPGGTWSPQALEGFQPAQWDEGMILPAQCWLRPLVHSGALSVVPVVRICPLSLTWAAEGPGTSERAGPDTCDSPACCLFDLILPLPLVGQKMPAEACLILPQPVLLSLSEWPKITSASSPFQTFFMQDWLCGTRIGE